MLANVSEQILGVFKYKISAMQKPLLMPPVLTKMDAPHSLPICEGILARAVAGNSATHKLSTICAAQVADYLAFRPPD